MRCHGCLPAAHFYAGDSTFIVRRHRP
jgi:hypothetical protein